jgi:hypothetical protein
MVRADDEHKSANEAEKNTSTRGSFFEKLKFWKRDKKDADEPAQLTPMPPCLMKWWVPFGLAGLLLAICTPIAFWWGGRFHWPSSAAMTLCATIVGTGFAFSAWQQRSHDNATKENERARAQRELEADRQEREQNRLEQIERDEYWKRREHIFQLLTSKNPALRLSAIELLAELADTADKSKLLNNSTKRQLQRHIVDTLCHQLRHEGLDHANDGDNLEHANIQESILRVIFTRINMYSDSKYCADWHTALIKIEDTNILTPITLTNITTEATLDLNSATFHEAVSIQNTKLRSLFWERATFLSTLTVGSDSLYTKEQPSVTLGTGAIPTQVTTATFNDVTFITEYPFFIIQPHTPSTNGHIPEIYLKQCRFINTRCHCTSQCQCRKQHTENQCLCLISNKCTCNRICINSQVSFVEASMDHTAADQQAFFSLQNSQTGRIFLTNTARTPFITLKGNHTTDQIFIFLSDARKQEPWTQVDIHDNTIFFGDLFAKPIEIKAKSLSSLLGAIDIGRNFIADPDNSRKRQEFSHLPTDIDTPEVTFTASTPTDFPPLISSWTTGKED